MKRKQLGFTLVEVMIVIVVIGVVAALSMPTLITKVNDKILENQEKVFKSKLIKGLNLTKIAGDLNNKYENTYDFLVNGLSKQLKMLAICDSDHIRECIPYDEIKYDSGDKEVRIDVKDLKTAEKLNLNSSFEDVAAFVLADPVIASYNLRCLDDPDKADTSINTCFAGLYDINGNRQPNKYSVILDADKKM